MDRKPDRVRSTVAKKSEDADLRVRYALHLEFGLLLSLAIVIGAFRAEFRASDGGMNIVLAEQEVVRMEEIAATTQEQKPPPPPRPPIPVEVPDDTVLQDDDLDLDASLDLDEPLASLPAPPPPPKPEEAAEDEEPEIFVIVENMPELIGGLQAIQSLVEYPEMARRAGIEGRVIVQFVVDERGRVIQPEVVRGIGGGCDQAAVDAVLQARFKPGRQRGKAVRVRFSLPITFRIRS